MLKTHKSSASILTHCAMFSSSWVLFCMFKPYFTWHGGAWVYSYPIIAFAIVFLSSQSPFKKKLIIIGMLIAALSSFFYTRIMLESNNIFFILYFGIQSIFFILLFSSTKIDFILLWKIFIRLFAIYALLGLVIYFGRMFIDIPFNYIEPANILKRHKYITFPGFVLSDKAEFFFLGRFCGVFDEPGAFGTLAALVLSFDKFRNKIPSVIILTASIFTFSLAFYILFIVFLVLSGHSFKLKLGVFFTILITLLLPFYVFNLETELQHFLRRFEITDYQLAGDNRDKKAFLNVYDQFLQGPIVTVFLGHGARAASSAEGAGGASIRMFLYDFGFLGLGIVVVVYSLIVSHKMTRGNMLSLFLFFLSMYQRPWLYNWNFVVLFSMGSFFDYEMAKRSVRSITDCRNVQGLMS